MSNTNEIKSVSPKEKLYLHSAGIFGIVLALFWLFPFYIMLVNSLKTKKEMFTDVLVLPESLNFENYINAFDALELQTTFFNSLIITIGGVVAIIAVSIMAAYALQRTKTKTSSILLFVFVSAMLIPFQSIMLPLVSLTSTLGIIGSRWGIIIVYIGFGVSMAIFLIHGALGGVPESMDEAAKIDGCNPLQTLFLIVLPMLKPILVTVTILDIVWIWNDYLLPSLLINEEELHTIPIKMFYFFGEYTKQWNLAMAGLTIAIVPVIIFYFIAQKQIIKGITDGAVK